MGGESLLRRLARMAAASAFHPALVVLGFEPERLSAELAGLSVQTIVNPDWQEGMASSIRAGLAALPEDAGAVLLLLCDQPGVDAALLARLHAAHLKRPSAAIASAYAGTLGIPALFPRRCFPTLGALRGDRGAKGLLTAPGEPVVAIPFPGGIRDLDTPEDVVAWRGLSR